MHASNKGIAVRHIAAESRFEIEVEGRRAVAEYERRGREITFMHTLVPAELRGRGLAEVLVRVGLAHARAEGLRVVPACSYVAKFIERHAEYRDLVGVSPETSHRALP